MSEDGWVNDGETVLASLLYMDGSLYKEIKIQRCWYVPPELILYQTQYFYRPSHSPGPLEYTIVGNVLVVP